MAQLIKMPAVAADSATGTLAQWLRQVGEHVAVGDPIAEIETDKAIVEITSEHAGVLARIIASVGPAQLPVNAILAVLTQQGEGEEAIDRALADAGAAVAQPSAGQTQQLTPSSSTASATPTGPTATETSATATETSATSAIAANESVAVSQDRPTADLASVGRRFSSPAARRIAAEHQIDLAHVAGSGPRGRILKDDVQRAASERAALTANEVTQDLLPTALAAETRTPHSNMRRAIARRLTESKQTIPHFYLTHDCRVDALLALRQQIMTDGQTRISVNDFVVRAAALALIEVPQMNVSWEADALVHHASADVAVAVATDGGLVTPIVRDAALKNLRQVAADIVALAARGREQRLKPAEYTGGSMTVSNLGMYGVTQFSAIINPPQAAILAVGAAQKRAAVDANGAIVAASIMTVTLSVDHRAVDGAVAAAWLAAFNRLIEQPVRILL